MLLEEYRQVSLQHDKYEADARIRMGVAKFTGSKLWQVTDDLNTDDLNNERAETQKDEIMESRLPLKTSFGIKRQLLISYGHIWNHSIITVRQ